jgi:hypothetical protein
MPLITCEMRWVLDGALPEEVERWFHGDREPAPPTWREDRYLILPGAADMGIKERQGRLEIKGRLAKLGSHAIAPGIEGGAERWCKWSYGAAGAPPFGGLQGQETVALGKGRAQQHFLLQPGGRAQEVAQRDALQQRGFSLEITRIRLSGADHWSLGIEAAPDDNALLDDLLPALAIGLQGFPLPLPPARSRSYPSWLLERNDASRRPA